MNVGYNKPLYILPFDHRSSFEKGLYGWSGSLTPEQAAKMASTKEVIYDAFKLALAQGLPRERAAILVDEQFGAAILRDASANGFITAMPAEKSGQAEFQLEFGDRYAAHIEDFKPTFVKVLLRYNPEDDEALNRRQSARLKQLSDYLHNHGHYFMIELLVPATHEQMDRLEGDHNLYDNDLRPSLMISTIKDLQNAGIEPDVWKVEGLDQREDCARDRRSGAARRTRQCGLHHPRPRLQRKESRRVAAQRRRSAGLHRLRRRPDVVLGCARGAAGWQEPAAASRGRYCQPISRMGAGVRATECQLSSLIRVSTGRTST